MKSIQPKILKASVISSIAGALLPSLVLAFAYYEYNYGPPIDASVAQGGFVIIIHFIAALAFCFLVFPIAGVVLHRKGTLTKAKFRRVIYLTLAVVSLLPAIILVFVGFGPPALFFALISFLILAVLCLPVGALWYKLAQWA